MIHDNHSNNFYNTNKSTQLKEDKSGIDYIDNLLHQML